MSHPSLDSLSKLLNSSLFDDEMKQDLFTTLVHYPFPEILNLFLCGLGYYPAIDKDKLLTCMHAVIKNPQIFFENQEVASFWGTFAYQKITHSHCDKIIEIVNSWSDNLEEGRKAFKTFSDGCAKIGPSFFNDSATLSSLRELPGEGIQYKLNPISPHSNT